MNLSDVGMGPLVRSPASGVPRLRSMSLMVVSNGSGDSVKYSVILVPFLRALKLDWSHCVGEAVLVAFGGGGSASFARE